MNEETIYDLDADESKTDAIVNDPHLLKKAFGFMVLLFLLLAAFIYILLAYPLYFLGVCASLLVGYSLISWIKR